MNFGFLLAILAAALWGITYVVNERVLQVYSPLKLYFLHCLMGALLSLLLSLASRKSIQELVALQSEQINPTFVLGALLTGAGATLAIFASIQKLNAVRAGLLEISYPLFIVLFGYLLFRETIDFRTAIGGVLIFAGSAVIISSSAG